MHENEVGQQGRVGGRSWADAAWQRRAGSPATPAQSH